VRLSVRLSVRWGPNFGFWDLDRQMDMTFLFSPALSAAATAVVDVTATAVRSTATAFFFFFFFLPFPAGCPGLISGFFFFFFLARKGWAAGPPFFFFFFALFGLPRVNTRVFFSRPFPTGCPGLIPGVFFFFQRVCNRGYPLVLRWCLKPLNP
jgi:hypothetical protein